MRWKATNLANRILFFTSRTTRRLFTNEIDGWRRFSTKSTLPNKGGLFGLGTIRSPKDFRLLTDNVYERGRQLVAEALGGRQRKRKLVTVLDDLSDVICRAADLAECVRMVHPHASFADEAEQCVSHLGQFVESLNSNRELYLTLRRSIETGDVDSACHEKMDEIDRRVMDMLVDDMETSGVHLPDAQRCQFIEYNSGLFAVGSEFVRAAHEFKTVENVRMLTPDDFLQRQRDRLRTVLSLRHRLARLVGYGSYAERAVHGSFLETPENVHQFLKTLVEELRGKKLLGDVIDQAMPTDTPEAEKKRLKAVETGSRDESRIAISLERLIENKINTIAERLLGVKFVKMEPKGDELWHDGVTKLVAYSSDHKDPLGVVYCDWFDRERKCGEAHFTVMCGRELRSERDAEHPEKDNREYQMPVVALSFRLTQPSENSKDYWTTTMELNGTQVETILHEFGHAFHTLIGRTRYQHVSGTRCSTDLAEIPSTFMEHYLTDEKASRPLWGTTFDAHRAHNRTNGVMDMLDQSLLALTDLRLNTVDPEQAFLDEISDSIKTEFDLPLMSQDRLLVFEHLIQYGGKYHSYLVAKALAALLWRRGGFVDEPFERHSGEMYRRFMTYGGEKYPNELMQLTLGEVPAANSLAKSLADDVAGNLKQQREARKKRSLE